GAGPGAAHQTLPCPHRGGRPSLGAGGEAPNSVATAKGAETRLSKLAEAAPVLPSVKRIALSSPSALVLFFSWNEPQAPSTSAAMTFLPAACFPLPAPRNLD
ncbi:hypothetical protein LEMLEM_LOCUS1443, partial [Lemmus lemmus]